jgi:hypothetical protein
MSDEPEAPEAPEAPESAEERPPFAWEYREEFKITGQMREMLNLTKKVAEAEIDRLRRKVDKLTYGSLRSMANNPAWQALQVKIPGKDLLKQVREILETLVIYLEVAKAILNVIKTLLQDIANPIRALVEALIALILSLLEALRRSGFYMWYNFPDLREDPSLKRHAGGYPAFAQRFKGSLLDALDINRPRPIPGFNKGGYLLIVADVQTPARLLRLIQVLIKFFAAGFTTPQYPAPANPKVVLLGDKGDPILAVPAIFEIELKGLAVEWSLGSSTGTPDGGFAGLVNNLANEFIPPKWLIERSSVYPSDRTTSLDGVGQLYIERPDPNLRDPRTGKTVIKASRVFDEYGQPVTLLENAEVISATQATATYILGILGTYRYLDFNVVKDRTYWYRIRAFSGDLDWDPETFKVNFTQANIKEDPNRTGVYYLEWPSKNPNDRVVMGQPSPLLSGKVPTLPKFDVLENLRRIFLLAFSLNFQLPLPLKQATKVDPGTGKLVPVVDSAGYPVYVSLFDANGNPKPGSGVQIGQGSLSNESGILGALLASPRVTLTTVAAADLTTSDLKPDRDFPWCAASVRLQAARLANNYASLMLEAGGPFIEQFRVFMQGPLPAGKTTDEDLNSGQSVIKSANTLEKLVFALTYIETLPGIPEVQQTTAIRNEFTWITNLPTVRTYGTAFDDPVVRKNVLAAVTFVQALGYQGQPPDWGRASLLQDIVPWSGQIIYKLLAKIQALLDAFNGIIADIVKFIDLIIRKIDALEKFIEFLISILNFIEQLSAGFYLLFATGLTNGVADWFAAIDNSVGDKPKSTADGGYTGGMCLAYLAPDVTPIETALKLIF